MVSSSYTAFHISWTTNSVPDLQYIEGSDGEIHSRWSLSITGGRDRFVFCIKVRTNFACLSQCGCFSFVIMPSIPSSRQSERTRYYFLQIIKLLGPEIETLEVSTSTTKIKEYE